MSKYFKVGSRRVSAKKLNKIIDQLSKVNVSAAGMGLSQGAGGTVIPNLNEDVFQTGRIMVVYASYLPPMYLETGKFWGSPINANTPGPLVRAPRCQPYFFVPDIQTDSFRMIPAPVAPVRVINWSQRPIVKSWCFAIQAVDDIYHVITPNFEPTAFCEWVWVGSNLDTSEHSSDGTWKLVRGPKYSSFGITSGLSGFQEGQAFDMGAISGNELIIRFPGTYKITYGMEVNLLGSTSHKLQTLSGGNPTPNHTHDYYVPGAGLFSMGIATALWNPLGPGVNLTDSHFEDRKTNTIFGIPPTGTVDAFLFNQETTVHIRQHDNTRRWFRVALGFRFTNQNMNTSTSGNPLQTPRLKCNRAWVTATRIGYSPSGEQALGINEYPAGLFGGFSPFGTVPVVAIDSNGRAL